MKKILFVITKSNWGGAQRYVFDLATHLPKEQFEVVAAHGGNGLLAEKLRTAGIRTIAVKNFERDISAARDLRAFFELITIFRRERPDIVHLNSSKAGFIGALAARVTAVPNILFTSHGLVFDEDRPLFIRALLWLATWVTFLLTHQIILISENTYRRAKQMPFVSRKMHLIYNGIEPMPPLPKSVARAQIEKLLPPLSQKNPLWIGTISELTKNKGLEYILRALARMPQHAWVFIIIGNDGEQRNLLHQLVGELNIVDRVFFVGTIPDAGKLLPAFDIFTLTSVKEGLPYVLLEAGQAGVPVLGSDIPGIRDIVRDTKDGLLVPPKDPGAIEKALRKFTGEKERATMATSLNARVKNTFTIEKMIAGTTALY